MKRKFLTVLAVALASGLALAQPSVYYLWKHKTSGKTVCEPEAPDANWIKHAGPFEDPNCKFKMQL